MASSDRVYTCWTTGTIYTTAPSLKQSSLAIQANLYINSSQGFICWKIINLYNIHFQNWTNLLSCTTHNSLNVKKNTFNMPKNDSFCKEYSLATWLHASLNHRDNKMKGACEIYDHMTRKIMYHCLDRGGGSFYPTLPYSSTYTWKLTRLTRVHMVHKTFTLNTSAAPLRHYLMTNHTLASIY